MVLTRSRARKRDLSAICAMVFFMGMTCLIISYLLLNAVMTTNGWPVAEGTVITSEVTSQWHDDYNDGEGFFTYSPYVVYEYQVNGTKYDGCSVTSFILESDLAYAQGVVNKYPVGSTVRVHYNPTAPSDSVLEMYVGPTTLIPFAFGIGLVVVGSVGLYQIRNKRYRPYNPLSLRLNGVEIVDTGVKWVSCDYRTLEPNEHILWKGRPQKLPFILSYSNRQSVFSVLLIIIPVASLMVGAYLTNAEIGPIIVGLIIISTASFPIAINIISRAREYQDTAYIVTDSRIIAQEGGKSTSYRYVDLTDIVEVYTFRNMMDRVFGTGSLVFTDTIGVDIVSLRHPNWVRNTIIKAALVKKNEGFQGRSIEGKM